MSFEEVLKGITLAEQIGVAVAPAVAALPDPAQRNQAVGQILDVANAAAQSMTTDPDIQQKASMAANLAKSVFPIVMTIVDLFHKHQPSVSAIRIGSPKV